MIIYKDGDILNSTENIIAHQANCIGKMGAGVALAIKQKYPKCFTPYENMCRRLGSKLLGTMQMIEVGPSRYICNLFGQDGIYGHQPTNYKALRLSLQLLYNYAVVNELSVAIPFKMGCGLGGGDWTVVKDMIGQVFHDYDISVYKL